MTITPAQCRAARAILGWNQEALVEASGVTKSTIANFEISKSNPNPRTIAALRSALEAAGIEFLESGAPSLNGGAGVRLRGTS